MPSNDEFLKPAKIAIYGVSPKRRTFAAGVKDKLEKETKATIMIWAGSCYGACDIPNIKNLGIDLLIQWGHSEWK